LQIRTTRRYSAAACSVKTALEQGGKNPAEAVRTVRGLSGMELAVVLAQLGAPAK
jgi:hypothetical protein